MKYLAWKSYLLIVMIMWASQVMPQGLVSDNIERIRPIVSYLDDPNSALQSFRKELECDTEENQEAPKLNLFTVHENGKCSLNLWNLYDLSMCKGTLYQNNDDIRKTSSGRLFCLFNALRKSGGTDNPQIQNFLEKFWFALMPENSFSWFIGSDLQKGVLPKESVLKAIDKLMSELEERSIKEHNSSLFQQEIFKRNRSKTKISTQDYIQKVIIPRLNLTPLHCYDVSMKTPPPSPSSVLFNEGMEVLEPAFSSFLPKLLTQKGVIGSEDSEDQESKACKTSKEDQERQFGEFYRGQIIENNLDENWNPKGKEGKGIEDFFVNYATSGNMALETVNARFILEVRQKESCPQEGQPSLAYIYECNLELSQHSEEIDFGCHNLHAPDTYLVSESKYHLISDGINQLLFKEMMSGGNEYLPENALYFGKEVRNYFEQEIISSVFSDENCKKMIASGQVQTDEATVLKACAHFRSKANLGKLLEMGVQFPSGSLIQEEYNLQGSNKELALKNAENFYEQMTGDPTYLNLSTGKNKGEYTLYAGKGDKDVIAAYDAIEKFANPEDEDILYPIAEFFYTRNDPGLRRFDLKVSENMSVSMDFSEEAKGDHKDLMHNRSGLMHPPAFFKEGPSSKVSGFKQNLYTSDYGDSFYIDSRKEEGKTPLPSKDWEKLQTYIKYQLKNSMESFAPFMIDSIAMGMAKKKEARAKEE